LSASSVILSTLNIDPAILSLASAIFFPVNLLKACIILSIGLKTKVNIPCKISLFLCAIASCSSLIVCCDCSCASNAVIVSFVCCIFKSLISFSVLPCLFNVCSVSVNVLN
jgi:hypothetical protein